MFAGEDIKLLNSYRSEATDSKVDIISKSLQDTEEGPYEDGDDETEHVYIKKLEYAFVVTFLNSLYTCN
ncbi:unnamed protein product [Lactuca virosa]|uniref:Uncharacterized protein n=1 Tax=Lactuca virosa TaxID=75947 RepID=A0AAU9PPJ6_9ASTR|nr:unnamed protein product [Lactuca virosa]